MNVSAAAADAHTSSALPSGMLEINGASDGQSKVASAIPDTTSALDASASAPAGTLQERPTTSRRSIGPVTLEVVNSSQAVAQIMGALDEEPSRIFAFCNMHTFNMATRMPALASVLSTATVFNDGLAMDIASNILFGESFPENLNGTDLMPAFFAALDRNVRVFFVGSPPGVAEIAARTLESRYPGVLVVGCQHGFFTPAEGDEIVQRIRDAKTDIVLLGMGNPRQELWAKDVASGCNAVILCVGAFLDFASGRISRAPRLLRTLRAEWLYRMLLEPRRLTGRYLLGAPRFLHAVLAARLKQSS